MDRFPWVITAGAMLLGYIAGSLAFGDPLLQSTVGGLPKHSHHAAGVCGALLVFMLGQWFTRRPAPN